MATMISHNKKFIFVHIYKTAGTSVSSVLAPYDDNPVLNHPIIRRVRVWMNLSSYNFYGFRSFADHASALTVRNEISNSIFEEFFKFAFVRNPWDIQVSLYHFMLKNKFHHQHNLIKIMSFEKYIEWRVENEIRLQKNFITDEDGKLLIDFVGKFENIPNDFKYICDKINIAYDLPTINKTKHDDYKYYYNDYTSKLIYNAYIKDIEFFEYEF